MWSYLKKAPPERGSGLGSFSDPCSGEQGREMGQRVPRPKALDSTLYVLGGYEELDTGALKSHLIHTERGALGKIERNWRDALALPRRPSLQSEIRAMPHATVSNACRN